MKRSLLIPILIAHATPALASNYDRLQEALQSNHFTRGLQLPSKEEVRKFEKNLREGGSLNAAVSSSIPEDSRPVRTAKATVRITKAFVETLPDGSSEYKEETLCEKIIYFDVFEGIPRISGPGFLRSMTCFDERFHKGQFQYWGVHLGGAVFDQVEPNEVFKGILNSKYKVATTFLYVGDFINGPNRPFPADYPRFASPESSSAGTTEMSSRSMLLGVQQPYRVTCLEMEPHPLPPDNPESPNSNMTRKAGGTRGCTMMDADIAYSAVVHVEDDQL